MNRMLLPRLSVRPEEAVRQKAEETRKAVVSGNRLRDTPVRLRGVFFVGG